MEALDLIGGGYITQASWDEFQKIYQNYSRPAMKKARGYSFLSNKSSSGVPRIGIG